MKVKFRVWIDDPSDFCEVEAFHSARAAVLAVEVLELSKHGYKGSITVCNMSNNRKRVYKVK